MGCVARCLIFMVSLALLDSVEMYSRGAPETACADMIPKHGATAQTIPSPYTVTFSKPTYKPSEEIEVVLSGSATFKGFLIMPTQFVTVNLTGLNIPDIAPVGRTASQNDPAQPVSTTGTLVSESATTNNCQTTALTHTDGTTKQSVTFKWTAPAENQGPIVFKYTVVQTKNVYWVGLSSGQIAFESKDDEDDDKNVSSHVLYSTSAILTSLLLCFFCVIQ